MPIKRRMAKGRALTEQHREELIEGPGTCLLAGLGYYLPHSGAGALPDEAGGFWWEVSPAAQTVLLERMKADWHRYGAEIVATTDGPIWALEQFGEPEGAR